MIFSKLLKVFVHLCQYRQWHILQGGCEEYVSMKIYVPVPNTEPGAWVPMLWLLSLPSHPRPHPPMAGTSVPDPPSWSQLCLCQVFCYVAHHANFPREIMLAWSSGHGYAPSQKTSLGMDGPSPRAMDGKFILAVDKKAQCNGESELEQCSRMGCICTRWKLID